MVQFCPRCGMKAPDDDAVFCNKCGTRLPPVVPEKKDIFCPRCGTKAPDEQSAFCNKCGSPLNAVPQVPAGLAGQRPAAVPPVIRKRCCPSCGAPLVDDISDFCNLCGANIRRPAPLPPAHESPRHSPDIIEPPHLTPARETPPPAPEKTIPAPARETTQLPPVKTGPVTPARNIPDAGRDVPEQRDNRRPLLKWGLVAIAVVIFLAVIVAFITGMIPGIGQSPDETPVPADTPVTDLPTQTTAPKKTTAPAKVTTKPPTTAVTTNTSANVTVKATATVTANVSANVTANVTPSVTKPLSNIDAAKSFSIGETATDGKGKLTLNGYSIKDKLGDPIPSYAIGKKYLILGITYENLEQNKTADVNLKGMTVRDTGGFTFEQVTDDAMLENPFYLNGKSVPPLENRTGNMAFIINPDATFLKFEYNFGNEKIAIFQLPQYL